MKQLFLLVETTHLLSLDLALIWSLPAKERPCVLLYTHHCTSLTTIDTFKKYVLTQTS